MKAKPEIYRLQEELERRILHGLASEWKEALWVLDSSHMTEMRRPHFSLVDMKKKLGSWSREKREICLSRNFVLSHPWDAVREVLLHETAHQFADEVLGAPNEPPHGPTFQRSCALLRANPKASGHYPPLDERILKASSQSDDRIMLKIRKLMALAKSPNQHEAESAMTKAHALIAKYNVDLLAQAQERNFVSLFLDKPALRHFRESYHLSSLLQDYYFVHTIWAPAYVLEKGKMGRVLEISGTPENISIASYVHDYVKRFIDVQWVSYNRRGGFDRYRKTDFAVGIVEGFRAKLESKRPVDSSASSSRHLMKVQDPMLVAYAAYKYPYTRGIGKRVATQDAGILNNGIQRGKELVISKGITHKGSKSVPFLE